MKKNSLTKLLALLLAISLVLGLAACSSSGKQEAPAAEEPAAEEPAAEEPAAEEPAAEEPAAEGEKEVEFEIWLTENDLTNMQGCNWLVDCANAYMADHPNVTIKLTCISQDPSTYIEKWKLGASTDTLPDVFPTTFGYLQEWAEAGVIVDMSEDLSNDQAFMDRFNPGAIECVNKFCPEGTIYGIPFKAETFGWLYNLNLFEQYNLEIPETWDELLHCVEVFNDNGITPIAQAGIDNWAVWGYHPFFTRYGFTYEMAQQIVNGELRYEDCEPIVKGFERMDELAKAGAFNEDAYAISHSQAMAMYTEGKAAMYTTYSGIVGDTPEGEDGFKEWSAYNVGPEFEDGALDGPSGLRNYSWNLAMGSVAKSDPDRYAAVIDFLKFCMSEDGTQFQVNYGQPVATKYDYSEMGLSRLEQDIQKSFSDDYISSDYAFSVWVPAAYRLAFLRSKSLLMRLLQRFRLMLTTSSNEKN